MPDEIRYAKFCEQNGAIKCYHESTELEMIRATESNRKDVEKFVERDTNAYDDFTLEAFRNNLPNYVYVKHAGRFYAFTEHEVVQRMIPKDQE